MTADEIMALARMWAMDLETPGTFRAAIERVIAQKDNWKHEAIEYANKADYWRDRSKATEVGCEKYLKEGETPAERMERDHLDSLALMGLLAKEKIRAERAEQQARAYREDVVKEVDANYVSIATIGKLEAERDALRALLHECRLQLEYLDVDHPTGTTPAVLARIDAALKERE